MSEEERYGKGQSGDELPPELADTGRRIEKIREAKLALEQEAAQALEEARRNCPDTGAARVKERSRVPARWNEPGARTA